MKEENKMTKLENDFWTMPRKDVSNYETFKDITPNKWEVNEETEIVVHSANEDKNSKNI